MCLLFVIRAWLVPLFVLEHLCSKQILSEWVLMAENKHNELLDICYVYKSYKVMSDLVDRFIYVYMSK